MRYKWLGSHPQERWDLLAVDYRGDRSVEEADFRGWCSRQSLGATSLRLEEKSADERPEEGNLLDFPFTLELRSLPRWSETLLESACFVAAGEDLEGVVLEELIVVDGEPSPDPVVLRRSPGRSTVGAALGDARGPGVVKYLGPPAAAGAEGAGTYALPLARRARPEIGLRDIGSLRFPRRPSTVPRILVLAPFLARGGAEHTLFETTRVLAERREFEFVFATLAPHRRELGDRRGDFRAVSPLIYSLGDLLHPGAMYGALLSLVDSLGIRLVYNANGTTLFYDFARRLRQDRPKLPILDHLYDHRVGYIEWYTPDLPGVIDWCVAENHPIAETLAAERAFPRERAPVLWPCGRAPGAFPAAADREATRRRLRAELGVAEDRLLVLTAARAHPQKRPLDWVALAERLRDQPFELLWVGGGGLEKELDRALAGAATLHARRLPFRDDIPELLVAADVACLVSDFEGLPVFLLESMQAGRPFVAPDVGDIGRVLRPSGAGVVTGPPGDVEAIARALETMLDPEGRERAARAAEAAAEQFGVDACADRYGALFREALVAR